MGGGLSGAVSGMVGRGVAGENPFDPRGLATDLLIGALPAPSAAGWARATEAVRIRCRIRPRSRRSSIVGVEQARAISASALERRRCRSATPLSDPLPPGKPVFTKSEYVEVDTSKLPPGSVVPDGVVGSAATPPGHVSVYVDDPKVLQDAAVKFKFPK